MNTSFFVSESFAGIATKLLWAFSLLVGATGCSTDNWQAKTYAASGRISINGQPPAGAVVTLHSVKRKVDQRGSNPWGIVRDDGTFSLSTYEQEDGAPPGEYAVTVRWPEDVTDMAAAMLDRLGGAYSNEERSEWKVTIEPGKTELPLIEIKGAKIKSSDVLKPNRAAPPMPGMKVK